jgi:small subunit ribosomal protein S8
MTDPIADLLIRIKNAYQVSKQTVSLPFSNLKWNILKILEQEGSILGVKEDGQDKKKILITLNYSKEGEPALVDVKRVSRPSCRVYVDKNHLPRMKKTFGYSIISTPAGIMTGFEARKKGLGGEVICNIFTAG